MSDESKQSLWGFAADLEAGQVLINVPNPGIYMLSPEQARDIAKELNAHALAVEAGVGTKLP
jgi:hypothetical protein